MCGCLLLLLAFVIFMIVVAALIFSTIAFVVKAAISFVGILLVVFVIMIIWGATRSIFGGMNMCGCLLLLLAFIIYVVAVAVLGAHVVRDIISIGCILLVVFIVIIIWAE